ncbi:hypothetical protein [Arthrobacter sp. VKM Ac-2550]|uniref:hypothetical protein n=1 Tax=Crystallibacter permensis TaxID=1938888 RepID=UPI0022261D31|nr:hypothetical protein [Arthrobacter sp. VKM Ac-2550]MCW2134982.1 hypothetical protein [Arthrobacter sp. VKM Ac-2550]
MSALSRTLSALMTAGLLAVSMAAPASAATKEAEQPALDCWVQYETGENHCVKQGEGLNAAVLNLYDKRIVEDGDEAAQYRDGSSVQATYILGTVYIDQDYGGTSVTFTTSISTTCNTHSFRWPELTDVRWSDYWSGYANDDIESFVLGPNCKIGLWADTYYNGSYYDSATNRSTLGWMNNQASSLWFTG